MDMLTIEEEVKGVLDNLVQQLEQDVLPQGPNPIQQLDIIDIEEADLDEYDLSMIGQVLYDEQWNDLFRDGKKYFSEHMYSNAYECFTGVLAYNPDHSESKFYATQIKKQMIDNGVPDGMAWWKYDLDKNMFVVV